jgi:hypothetical protein
VEDTKLRKTFALGTVMLALLTLLATVTFWGTFLFILVVINAIPIHGLSLCVPAIFSALITGLVLIYTVKESFEQ